MLLLLLLLLSLTAVSDNCVFLPRLLLLELQQ